MGLPFSFLARSSGWRLVSAHYSSYPPTTRRKFSSLTNRSRSTLVPRGHHFLLLLLFIGLHSESCSRGVQLHCCAILEQISSPSFGLPNSHVYSVSPSHPSRQIDLIETVLSVHEAPSLRIIRDVSQSP